MKKFIIIFCFILFISFNINLVTVTAQYKESSARFYNSTNFRLINAKVNSTTLTQGIYKVSDTNLSIGSPVTATLDSPNNKVVIIVINSKQEIQELIRLGPKTIKYNLKPLSNDSSIIIFGNGAVTFSW